MFNTVSVEIMITC